MSALISLALCMASAVAAPQKPALPAVDSTAILDSRNDTDVVEVSPGRDQSGSWVAFRHLGGWTPEIQKQMERDNPGIPLAQLPEGKPIKLRRSLDRRGLPRPEQIQLALRKAVAVRVVGHVDVTLPSGESHRLQTNEFISAGSRIRTRKGASTELVIDNQSILRLRENSRLSIEAIQDSDGRSTRPTTQVALEEGSLWTKVRKWAGALVNFQVKLPLGIAGVHGTIFECTVTEDGQSEVKVLEGVVGVTGTAGTGEALLIRGQVATITSDGSVTPPRSFSPPPSAPSEESETLRLRESDLRLAALAQKIPRFPYFFGRIPY